MVIMLNKSIDIPIVLMLDEDEPLLYWITYHKVKKGETIYDIAQMYSCYDNRDDISELVADIKRVNKLNGSKLKVGKHIIIPIRKYEITVESKEE